MNSRIPLPSPNHVGEVFKDVFDYWENIKKRKAQEEQFAQEQSRLKSQFGQEFGLKQKAEQRIEQTLPYLIRQYEDTHKEKASKQQINDMYNNIVMDATKEGQIESGETTPEKEIIVRPAKNPKLKALDKIAGLHGSPVAAPKVSHYQGYTYTTYPSGEIRAVKMSPDSSGSDKMQSPFGKAVADLQYIENKHGKEHPLYKQGLEYLQRVAEGTPGVELKVDPKTGAISFTQGSKGKVPAQQIVDGKLVQTPTTQTQSQQQAQQMSNVARIGAFKGAENPYIGRSSNADIMKDYMDLISGQLNPDKKKQIEDKLVQAAVAAKMVPEIASLQLQSQNVRATVPALKHQKEAIMQGWPASLNWVVGNLPPYLQKVANEKHTDLLSQLTQEKNKFFAQGMPIPLENEKAPDITQQIEQLNKWADEAIRQGRNPGQVKKKLEELKSKLMENKNE